MRFDLFTLFSEICHAYLQESILKRAQEAGLLQTQVHNIRDYAEGRHLVTDDLPHGGGGGMVMKPKPVFAAADIYGWPLLGGPVDAMYPVAYQTTISQQGRAAA